MTKPRTDTPPAMLTGDSPVPLEPDLLQIQDSRRAALNLMEDAVQSRQATETLNGQLLESEERYRALFDLGPVAVYSCDASGVIQQFNRRAIELWGREPAVMDTDERFCGSFKMFRPDGSVMPYEQCPMAEVVRGTISEVHDAEVIIARPDGSRVTVVVNIRPLKSQQGYITGAINCFHDITARKQAEEALRESRARLQFALDSAQIGDWDLDLTNDTSHRSLRHDQCFGYNEPIPETEWGFEKFIQHVHPEDRAYVERQFHEAVTQQTDWHFECRVIWPDSSVHWIVAHGSVYRTEGKPTRMLGTVADITERKKAEKNLQQLNDQLETEVFARTRELIQSHEQLRALATALNLTEQRERKKIADELHDHLAQLLVLGKLKLGQGRRLTESPEKRDALIAEIDEVLSDALTYTRTLVAELSPPILYEYGLLAALTWLSDRMQRHGLVVTVHNETEPLKLSDDQAVPLFQSIRELLMNAAKHAKSGKATVRLERRSDEMRIEVRDEGVGFDLTAAGTPVMSLQFGLFSIRERMNTLGGRFELDSTPGHGTAATLVLPLSVVAVADSEFKVLRSGLSGGAIDHPPTAVSHRFDNSELSTSPTALDRIRVLLVDDHAMIRQGLRSVLESYPDVEIVGEACNGEQAVAAADALQPTVVLMDINMPKMNGIEATELIKARSPKRIVIGLSVNAGGANAEAMRQAGAAMLLTKEAPADDLYMAIHMTVNGGHQA
jgi:PAS domain S-box-containing protein